MYLLFIFYSSKSKGVVGETLRVTPYLTFYFVKNSESERNMVLLISFGAGGTLRFDLPYGSLPSSLFFIPTMSALHRPSTIINVDPYCLLRRIGEVGGCIAAELLFFLILFRLEKSWLGSGRLVDA